MMKMYTIIFDSDYLHTLSKWKDYIWKENSMYLVLKTIQNDQNLDIFDF